MQKKITIKEVRSIISSLNRANLDKLEFETIVRRVNELTNGFRMRAFKVHKGQELYRSNLYSFKPDNISFFSYPPVDRVQGYQRCNAPYSPMFYCSPDPKTTYSELRLNQGDRAYLSKWVVESESILIADPINDGDSTEYPPVIEIINTYFESKYLQPVHSDFSSQYKVTAAIAEVLVGKKLNTGGVQFDGLHYPSVADTNRTSNLALFPSSVDENLRLLQVDEIELLQFDDRFSEHKFIDFSSTFDEDGVITWKGSGRTYRVPNIRK